MTTRHAACSCGQLHLTIEGESVRISMCHCLACQRRTGAVFSNQASFRREQVTFTGKATTWNRTAESASVVTFNFCPTCGSTVYWENESFPGRVIVAIGKTAKVSLRVSQAHAIRVHAEGPRRHLDNLGVVRSRRGEVIDEV